MTDLSADRARLLQIVQNRGLIHFDEPRQLSSGEWSHDFIDAKYALSRGEDLRLSCKVISDTLAEAGIEFDAVGGLTLGADQFAHGVAAYLADHREWFVVRKQPKGRGTNQLVEGAKLVAGTRVVLTDDIVTTGGSIQQAFEKVVELGVVVAAGVTLVDRGDVAAAFFEAAGVPYFPIFTYHDLEIPPVGVSGT
jgi:orotate phosphoribosyltransferase